MSLALRSPRRARVATAAVVGAATITMPASPALADVEVGDDYRVEAERLQSDSLPEGGEAAEQVVGATPEIQTASAPGDWLAGGIDVDLVHTVQAGDSLGDLAAAYGIAEPDGWHVLFDANEDVEDPAQIWPGLELEVPVDGDELTRRDLPAPPAPAEPEPTAERAERAERADRASRSSAPEPDPEPEPAEPATTSGGRWDALAACESGGNWSINTGNGYYGGLQFSLQSWQAVGGSGYPHEASKAEQIRRAEMLQARQGWGAWPACTSKLGWR